MPQASTPDLDAVGRADVAYWLGRLPGQIASPPGMPPDCVRFILAHKLAVFHEWPSGHWQVTERGWEFRAEVVGSNDDL